MSYERLAQSVTAGDAAEVVNGVRALLDAGEPPLRVIDEGLIAGMNVVGARFKNGELFLPEVLMAVHAMGAGLELVRPLVPAAERKSKGRVALGTVKGDRHDIGKNLVAMMLEGAGLEVVDLGVDVSPKRFVDAVREHRPDIVGMSALLTTTTPEMEATIELLTREGLRGGVKVIVGGAPVTGDFARTIGADGFAPDAGSAAELCLQLVAG